MNRRRLLGRQTDGALDNVAFNDLIDLVKGFEFCLVRVSGSHHLFAHSDIVELINLQSVRGESKPYQIRQFLRLVERYNLQLMDKE